MVGKAEDVAILRPGTFVPCAPRPVTLLQTSSAQREMKGGDDFTLGENHVSRYKKVRESGPTRAPLACPPLPGKIQLPVSQHLLASLPAPRRDSWPDGRLCLRPAESGRVSGSQLA